ncbi:hypothetical protein JOB18_044306 [Solea senegalensis]|uniref:Uncharacterized protein n=1 Tax=Solea senegalensis TaxID=28829 RepID=A0AAV6Q565_SOLSE|nr:hypothetical protein JOB18_044306 [Solea senegalensis]
MGAGSSEYLRSIRAESGRRRSGTLHRENPKQCNATQGAAHFLLPTDEPLLPCAAWQCCQQLCKENCADLLPHPIPPGMAARDMALCLSVQHADSLAHPLPVELRDGTLPTGAPPINVVVHS